MHRVSARSGRIFALIWHVDVERNGDGVRMNIELGAIERRGHGLDMRVLFAWVALECFFEVVESDHHHCYIV